MCIVLSFAISRISTDLPLSKAFLPLGLTFLAENIACCDFCKNQ